MDKLHPNHDHFGQICEICNGKRPDKTSLMLHKLTHLTSNESSGPKIKIITASEVQGMKKFIKFVITYYFLVRVRISRAKKVPSRIELRYFVFRAET